MQNYSFKEFDLLIFHNLDSIKIKNQNIDFNIIHEQKRYAGTASTIENIKYLMKKYKDENECNKGRYFFQHNMIILEEMTITCLYEAIIDILKTTTLGNIFYLCSDET